MKLFILQGRFAKRSLIVTLALFLIACAPPIQDDRDTGAIETQSLTAAPDRATETPGTPKPVVTGGSGSVGQWKMYEITLSSTVTYNNPFTDVEVFADFTSPGSEVTRVYGFYDGNGAGGQGNLWKIRFMTEELGNWSWQTISSDTSNQGLHDQTGSVMVVNSSEPGLLYPDPEAPTAWKHANGENFYWNLGYSIHMLGADRTHEGVGGWLDYLDWLKEHRFNGVMFTLQVASFSSCSTCAKGMAPWNAIGNNAPPIYAINHKGKVDYFIMPWARVGDPNSMGDGSDNTDFSRFYLPLWTKADEVVQEMQDRRMIANIIQYSDEIFWPEASSSDEKLYWDYIIRRLGAYWNVVYNDGIDLNEYRQIPTWVDEWQQYFQARDVFDHARSSRHGSDDADWATWRSMQAANSVDPKNIGKWREFMKASPLKPVTEDDGVRTRKDDGISPERFMQLAWWSILSGPGGFGVTWAGAYDPGNWYANLDSESEGMLRVEVRTRFILDFNPTNGKQIPFWELEVRDDLVDGDNVYCSAVPGEHYLIYFDNGSPGSVNVDLSVAKSPLYVTWMNPETGQRIDAGVVDPGGSQPFDKPFSGPAVLYIGDKGVVGGE